MYTLCCKNLIAPAPVDVVVKSMAVEMSKQYDENEVQTFLQGKRQLKSTDTMIAQDDPFAGKDSEIFYIKIVLKKSCNTLVYVVLKICNFIIQVNLCKLQQFYHKSQKVPIGPKLRHALNSWKGKLLRYLK